MGNGAVVHTLNPRLFPADLEYIAGHASDRVLFFDLTFLKLTRELRPRLKTVKRFVIMTDRAHMPADASKVCLWASRGSLIDLCFGLVAIGQEGAPSLQLVKFTKGNLQ